MKGGKKKGKEGMKEVMEGREGRNEYVCSCVFVKWSARLLGLFGL